MNKPFLHQLTRRAPAVFCALALGTGCTGRIGPGGAVSVTAGTGGATTSGGTGGTGKTVDPNVIVVNPPPFAPAPGMLRRLTRTQLRNALNDVFGYAVDVNKLDADSWDANMATVGASVVVTSDQGAEQYNTAVESAVDAVFSVATKRSQLIGCTPSGQSNDSCLRGYIQKVGLRAWRRPLTSAELDGFGTLAANASTILASAVEGARWATVALFESPYFLYRPELGAAAVGGALRFTSYEMAERLSFLIWNSLPDQLLLDQATTGALATVDGMRSAAARMLGTTAGRESVGNFAEEYLRLDRIPTQAKDPVQYPAYGPNLQTAMVRDMRDTWTSLVFDDNASTMDLFTTTKVIVNSDLASLYGIDSTGLTSTTFQTRSLPADGPRAGILGKAALLSAFANQQSGSPTLRGKFIRESLICGTVPPPPPGVNTAAVDQPTDVPMTKRQRLELHRSSDLCASCHSQMDPLGLPLESFDAIGRFRTTDNGLPIDPSSTFEGQPIADSRALGIAASQSVGVAQCFVQRYYTYAMGHRVRDVDGSVLNALATTFNSSGFKMRDLILAVVTNDAFSSVAPQL